MPGGLPTRVNQVGTKMQLATLKPRISSINCQRAAGQDRGEGFTNLYAP